MVQAMSVVFLGLGLGALGLLEPDLYVIGLLVVLVGGVGVLVRLVDWARWLRGVSASSSHETGCSGTLGDERVSRPGRRSA